MALLLLGCEPSGEAPPRPGVSGPAGSDTTGVAPSKPGATALGGSGPYETIEVENGGVLRVRATYAGETVPEVSEVPVNINVDVCGHKVFTESVLVDAESRGLENVVVRLEGIRRGKAPPETVTVTNKDCSFAPHVGVAMKGAKIDLRNDDPVLHTTAPTWAGGGRWFNVPLPPGAPAPRARPIPSTGILEIKCDVHLWMNGYVVVHTNPYVAVTGPDGSCEIDDVPPGRYPYIAWHEQLGEQKGEVEIPAGGAAEIELEFAPAN